MKENMFKKFISFSYGNFVGIVIGFLSTIVMTRLILPEDFGKASMFILAINFGVVFSMLGTDQAFIRFFYEEQENKRGLLLRRCIGISGKTVVLGSLILIIFQEKLSKLIFAENQSHYVTVIILLVVNQMIQQYGLSVLRMEQKGKTYSNIQILYKVLNFLGMLGLYCWMGSSFEVILGANFLSVVLCNLVLYFKTNRFLGMFSAEKGELKTSQKQLIRYAIPLVLTMLLSLLFEYYDRIALNRWSNFNEIGMYSAAYKIVALLSIVQGAFTNFWVPISLEKYTENHQESKFFVNMHELVSLIMFTLGLGCILFKNLLILLLGKAYGEASLVIVFLVFVPVMYTISETTVLGINFAKKTRYHLLISIVTLAINVWGNSYFVPKYGAVGAALTTAFSYILFLVLRTEISHYFWKIDFRRGWLYFNSIALFGFAIAVNFGLSGFGMLAVGLTLFTVQIWSYKRIIKEMVKKFKNRIK